MKLKFSKKFLLMPFLLGILFLINPSTIKADETQTNEAVSVDFTINHSSSDTALVTDNSYKSSVKYLAGTGVNITTTTPIKGLYIKWYHNPSSEYTISYNQKQISCGKKGFLHEYIALDEETTEATINLTEDMRICEIVALSDGKLPMQIQNWEEPCTNPDMLVFSTHADDEILFLGGVLATYGARDDVNLQVAYMCDFYQSEPYREHEELDGLWTVGLVHYPVKGNFYDYYCADYDAALKNYSYADVSAFVTEQIRKFKPTIVVTQDLNGEYGHGGHQLLAHCVAEAVDHSNDSSFNPESAAKYGTHDVLKTYLHLYGENQINLNLRTPLSYLNNQTALDCCKEAYKKHESQQYCWFYVDDEYEYSCAKFGLYRSLVGADSNNDMLDNVSTKYEEELAKAEASKAEAAQSEALKANEKNTETSDGKEARTSKGLSLSIKQIISTLIALIIIFIVIFFQFKRHEKEYNKRVKDYKNEHKNDK